MEEQQVSNDRLGKKKGSRDWKKYEKQEMVPIEQDDFVTEIIKSLKTAPSKNTEGKRGRPKICTDEQIANAIIASGGFISRASEMLGMHYTSVHSRIQKVSALRNLVDHINEKLLDYGELELLKAMKRGESWAICFFLKCKGKDRGYIEKQTVVTTKDDNSVQIIIE